MSGSGRGLRWFGGGSRTADSEPVTRVAIPVQVAPQARQTVAAAVPVATPAAPSAPTTATAPVAATATATALAEPVAPPASARGAGLHAGGHRAGRAVGLVSGSVRSADGWPVPDAAVTVVDAAGRQVGFTVTGDMGDFVTEVSAAGHLTVVIAAAGSQPLARSASAAPGQRYELGELELAPATGSLPPTSGVWTMDPAHSIVRATARHIGLARVEGRFTEFTGSISLADPIEASTMTVVIDAASITTGNEARDTHLRSPDFLDVGKFPTLTYRALGILQHAPDRATVTGELTIRDVTREVPLRVTYVGSGPDPWGGDRIAFSATAQLARRDYEISWNMGLPGGLTVVGPTLQIDLDIEAVRSDV